MSGSLRNPPSLDGDQEGNNKRRTHPGVGVGQPRPQLLNLLVAPEVVEPQFLLQLVVIDAKLIYLAGQIAQLLADDSGRVGLLKNGPVLVPQLLQHFGHLRMQIVVIVFFGATILFLSSPF